jgi:hypothetical protein
MGLPVPRSGADKDHGVLHCLFQKKVYLRAFQVYLIPRRHGYIALKNLIRQETPLYPAS